MSETLTKQNKMGVLPISKLIITMSLPIMLSMLVQALYNIVDSIFVAKVSDTALTAVSLAFPIQNLMIAIGTGTGVGINALLSRSLGEKNYDTANRAAHNGLLLAVFSAVLFLIFGLFFPGLFFRAQSDNPTVIEYGTDYLRICTVFSLGVFGQIATERLLQATGKTIYTMFIQGTGAVINIILDYCLIFGKFGLPEMGVSGAAAATVIGQSVACCMGIFFNLKVNHELTFSLKAMRPHLPTIGKIYAVGIPSILLASLSSVMTFCMNTMLRAFGEVAINVFGVYFKLQSFVFMPVFGLNNGVVPIIAFNFGAGNTPRIMKAIKLAMVYAVSLMVIGFSVFQLAPQALLRMFDADAQMLAIGVPALRLISISFLFAGLCIISISSMQALGHGVTSLIISATRQLVFLIPLAFLFSRTGNVDRIWLAFPCAEVITVVLCIFFLRRIYKHQLVHLRPAEDAAEPTIIPETAGSPDVSAEVS